MHQDRDDFDIEVFYDGGCPLCLREIKLLKRWDGAGRIRFIDIDAPTFDATAVGKTQAELMARMQGRLPSGTWIEGVEVFRRMYAAVGFKRLVAVTRWPLVSHLLELGYALFAKNRLRLTGRCTRQTCNAGEMVADSR
jgi:predicted DCC family thiol-disulfide oxidoreductase YuxK